MAWLDTHSICDLPAGYRAARACYFADTILGLGDADVADVATAEAACLTAANNGYVGERFTGINSSRGFRVASNLSATFGSTMAALLASLPDNDGNTAMMVSGS